MTSIAVVTGNPKPASRTHGVALAVADVVAAALDDPAGRLVIDLTEHAPRLFDWSDPELTRLNSEVAAADIAIFASPTYKASYTGLLKAFLDRYGSNGLAGVTAVPVMTGGWPGHLLAVEVHLRPVLVEARGVRPVSRPVRHRAGARRPGQGGSQVGGSRRPPHHRPAQGLRPRRRRRRCSQHPHPLPVSLRSKRVPDLTTAASATHAGWGGWGHASERAGWPGLAVGCARPGRGPIITSRVRIVIIY